jgi:hypothetical protein
MGRYSGASPHPFFRTGAHLAGAIETGEKEDAHAYLVAFAVGELACVVFGHLLITPSVLDFHFPPPLEARLLQIWPAVHEVVNWPPTSTLDDAHMDAIVRALGPSSLNPQAREPGVYTETDQL